jgi:hypothetical protein
MMTRSNLPYLFNKVVEVFSLTAVVYVAGSKHILPSDSCIEDHPERDLIEIAAMMKSTIGIRMVFRSDHS